MNEKQALQDVENALRDFISAKLAEKFGADWYQECGLSEDRINKWLEKLESEKKKQRFSTCDSRPIYYSDFYDLRNLLQKNWEIFHPALGDKRETDVFLGLLENYRNSSAHGRELLTYQKHLAIGIAGEFRNRITKFRSMQETGESYFPRIESVHDNYGNSWKIGDNQRLMTKNVLREGDFLEFVVSAIDPQGELLEYCVGGEWQEGNVLQLELSSENIGLKISIVTRVKSKRNYHAIDNRIDAFVTFCYDVLPKKA